MEQFAYNTNHRHGATKLLKIELIVVL